MPLWGIGEYRTANLSLGRTGDETGLQDVPIGEVNPCLHEGIHINKFLHEEPPTWLNNRAASSVQGVDDPQFVPTITSGPANDTHTSTVDPMFGQTLETSGSSSADDLNQCLGRGLSSRTGPIDDSLRGSGQETHKRLVDGGRGSGYHYEYQYIDTNGNHRRRFVHLVATSANTDLEGKISAATTSAEWGRDYQPSSEG